MSTHELRQDCAQKRDVYQHAKAIYSEALRLVPWSDHTALRTELEQALVAYYVAHGALHVALKHPVSAADRLH